LEKVTQEEKNNFEEKIPELPCSTKQWLRKYLDEHPDLVKKNLSPWSAYLLKQEKKNSSQKRKEL
jgi:hypothetical protein